MATPRKPVGTTALDRAEASNEKREKARAKRKKQGEKFGEPGSITDAEALLRLRIVEQCLVDGKSVGAIMQELEEVHDRKLTYSAVSRYIVKVRDKWAREDALTGPVRRERQLRKLHEIAFRLEGLQAWGHWLGVQKLIADIEGNNAPLKVEHAPAEPFEGWSLKELQTYVESGGKAVPGRLAGGGEATGQGNQPWSEGPTANRLPA